LEKCASEFEKEVLYEIYKRGLVLPDKVNKTIFDKNIPIAQADFFFTKKNIVLFIDGEPHNKEYVIKADEKKRRELANLGYRVHSIHYSRALEDMQKLSVILER
jgi:very-short-patch-repair endonuclease